MSGTECGSMGPTINEWDRVWINGRHYQRVVHSVEPWGTLSLSGKKFEAVGAIIIKGDRVWIHGSHHH